MKVDKTFITLLLGIFFISIGSGSLHAQQAKPSTMLEKDYPYLYEKFGNELKAQKANYVFAIDVSGTMNRYENIVVPAMTQFIESLSNGDNVSIIRFGTDSKVSLGGFCDISNETRQSLKQYIRTLYQRDKDLYSYTDLNRLLQQLNKQLQIQKNDLTFIFILTDFIDDPAPKHTRLTAALCNTHRQRLTPRAIDHSMYMYALQLPVNKPNQLQLFRTAIPDSYHFEEFSITSPQALKSWFDRKKDEIQLDRFRAVIQRANLPVELKAVPYIDRDGNLSLDVNWHPNRLFDTLVIRNIHLQHTSAFRVETQNYLPAYIRTSTQEKLEAGRICHARYGFHRLNDTLCIETVLPTPYDNELQKLEIDKNEPTARLHAEGWLFTFFLPLWLCAVITALALIYLILVIKAAIRNLRPRWRLNGNLEVTYSSQTIARYEMAGEKSVSVGCHGQLTVSAYNCDWQLVFFQKTFSCWKFWKKPKYKVTMEQGNYFETANGTFQPGDITGLSKGDFVQVGNFLITWN